MDKILNIFPAMHFNHLISMLTPNQPYTARMYPFPSNKMPGFFFRKRNERIDWRRLGKRSPFLIFCLASVDVVQIANQMNIDALQENLMSVAFCDITSEIVCNHLTHISF